MMKKKPAFAQKAKNICVCVSCIHINDQTYTSRFIYQLFDIPFKYPALNHNVKLNFFKKSSSSNCYVLGSLLTSVCS